MTDPTSPPKPKKPVSPFLAGLLKNAKATPRQAPTSPGLQTKVCASCGAGRAEGSELSTCEYCGGSFFGE